MKDIHLFGVTTTTGKYLEKKICSRKDIFKFIGYSRKNLSYKFIDFNSDKISITSKNNIIISCAPIWEFVNYINKIKKFNKKPLKNINAFIVCSSSSVITKRFSFNNFDKELVKKLNSAEQKLIKICQELKIKCIVIRPTLIYGCFNGYSDNNLRLLVKIMRSFPFIFFPKNSGLRQPIHASQLADAIFYLLETRIISKKNNNYDSEIINIGGDEELKYRSILIKLKNNFPKKDSIKRCLIIEIPQLIFIFFTLPIFLFSPKAYEALMRLNSNLSGFLKVSNLINSKEKKFPVRPLSE